MLFYRCFFTAPRYASAVCCRHVFACLSVRPSQAGIVSKRLDESIRFWHWSFLLYTLFDTARRAVRLRQQSFLSSILARGV